MKRLLLPILTLTSLAPFSAHALTITIDAETLRDAAGGLFPVSGLVVLTAATEGTFLGPTPTSFGNGSEIVISKWDLSTWGTAGALSDIAANLSLSGNWDPGDALRLYWYPTLTLNSTAPGLGTEYGTYTDAVGIDGSAPWITPSQSSSIGLILATTDASQLLQPGSVNPASGLASHTVTDAVAPVPEPGTAGFGLACLAALAARRRQH